jgi:hypothetical protein
MEKVIYLIWKKPGAKGDEIQSYTFNIGKSYIFNMEKKGLKESNKLFKIYKN